MPRNLELKARLSFPLRTKRILEEIGIPGELMIQTDTYFNVRVGRLKLREISDGGTELIYYRRRENGGPRWSDFEIIALARPKEVKRFLTRALGVLAIVRKVRKVYYFKKVARIHLDSVRGLGKFIELEVMSNGRERKVKLIHDELVELLGIRTEKKISSSYSDLMIAKQSH